MTPLTISMRDPESKLMAELQDRQVPQSTVAIAYAFLMAQPEGERANWPAINAAIQRRWNGAKALQHVKSMANKHLNEWEKAREYVPEIRVSSVAHYAEEGNPNPLIVACDADGVLQPVTRTVLCRGEFISERFKHAGWVLVMETER